MSQDQVVAGQPATVRALITDQYGRWLLVRDRDKTAFTLPGGKLKQNEQPRAGVEREVAEETGQRIRAGRLLVLGWQPVGSDRTPAIWSLIFDGGHLNAHTADLKARAGDSVEEIVWALPAKALNLLHPTIRWRLEAWRALPTDFGAIYLEPPQT